MAAAMPATARALSRTAGWIALGYFLLIAVFVLWNAFQESDGTMLLLALLIIPWVAAPIVGASLCAGASSTGLGAALFVAVEAGFILSVAWIVADFTYIHPSSMGGVALLLWPLVQWVALVVVLLLAFLFGWRARPNFLEE